MGDQSESSSWDEEGRSQGAAATVYVGRRLKVSGWGKETDMDMDMDMGMGKQQRELGL